MTFRLHNDKLTNQTVTWTAIHTVVLAINTTLASTLAQQCGRLDCELLYSYTTITTTTMTANQSNSYTLRTTFAARADFSAVVRWMTLACRLERSFLLVASSSLSFDNSAVTD